jgi:Baseplate J-like protein
MTTPSPKIDQRIAGDISRQTQELIKIYAPAWQEFDPATGQATGVSGAVLGVFARFSEIIIQRINEAPQKNFLAFLDLLGAALLPPQPARAPLTFSLAAGSAVDGLVPAGTQVAAPPAEGAKEPVIFETERELTVTAAQLVGLFVRDPERDLHADISSIITTPSSGEFVFQGNQLPDHLFYLAHSRLLGFPQINGLRLQFVVETPSEDDDLDRIIVEWEIWDGSRWTNTFMEIDGTQGLRISGTVDLGAAPPMPEVQVNGIQNHWVRGHMFTPITISEDARLEMVRATHLPKVRQAKLEVHLLRPLADGLSPESAFTNAVAIEPGKDFFPFGEKPKLNDALYLASAEAFSKGRPQGLESTSATVQLDVRIANSHLMQTDTSVRPSADLQLAWECWDGAAWQPVGRSDAPPWLRLLEVDPLPTVTNEAVVTAQGRAQKGAVVVARVNPVAPRLGIPIPVNIGEDGRFAFSLQPEANGLYIIEFTAALGNKSDSAWAAFFRETGGTRNVELVFEAPSAPVPTSLTNLVVDATGSQAAAVVAIRITNASSAFQAVIGPKGVELPINLIEGRNHLKIEGLSTSGATLAIATLTVGRIAASPAPGSNFNDGTHAFCQSGIVEFTLPDQVAPVVVNGQENFWLRTRIIRGDYGKDTRYKLKTPTDPNDGFTLVLDSFRPPLLSSVKIGYEQTLAGAPEVMLTHNNLTFETVKNADQASDPSFAPFVRAPEDRPTLYVGFALPPERTVFPNRKISLYARAAELRYDERLVPISPERSKKFGDPGSEVIHTFVVTNTESTPAFFSWGVFGSRWQSEMTDLSEDAVPAGASLEVTVRVTIPPEVALGESDRGFLVFVRSPIRSVVYGAEFVTTAGEDAAPGEQVRLVWEYWNGSRWATLAVSDDTENFTRPGLIEFLARPDFATRQEFAQPPRYWLRVRWEKGEYALAPRLRRMLLNTTIAAQTLTLRNETLGSSDGSGGQKFRATRAPILAGQRLEVREPEIPSAAEQEALAGENGEGVAEDAITIVRDAAGRPKEIWVRWSEAPDFYASGPRSRHYVLDHLNGEIRFGDGLNGLIPPAGAGNIRLARYQVGGGKAGNKPAGAIVQLKTTVPYVDKVTNTESAAGGADAEVLDSLLQRAPRTIRHGGRAVTSEDYEDLALLSSPEVARAKCIPLRNLIEDPLDQQPATRGEISVIIVPRSSEAKPQPSLELIARVQDYLESHSSPTARVSVVGPLYVRVDVAMEITLVSLEGASVVEQTVRQKLAAFLHPLTGGLDGAGWDFGRKPHASDLYALIEAVPGVDHVHSLTIAETQDQPGVTATGRFLVFSGAHTISLLFEEG